jgi:hypothetical protein
MLQGLPNGLPGENHDRNDKMTNVDQLIELISSDIDDRPVSWLNANGMAPVRPVIGKRLTRANFTPEEDKFLKENLQYLGDEECARRLGRTFYSVHVHSSRKGFIRPRHAEGYLSGNVISKILGVDSHCVPCWFDLGIMESESFPYDREYMWKRRVKIPVFKRWLIRPKNWVYFNVNKMTDLRYQRLVQLAQAKWDDEWWTTRQGADYVGAEVKCFLTYLINHHLPAIHAVGKDRNRNQYWAYWFVPKSVVMQIHYPHGKGKGLAHKPISDRAMKFIVMARDEWGKTWEDIRRMMRTEIVGWTIRNRYEAWKRGA